jgi:hypothetical protein
MAAHTIKAYRKSTVVIPQNVCKTDGYTIVPKKPVNVCRNNDTKDQVW